MTLEIAKKCFEENLLLFGDAKSEPEKYNLYKGLAHLANAIEDLQRASETLAQNQASINNNINRNM